MQANKEVKRGIYRHYKGGMYEVQSIAKHTETMEELVIYRALNVSEKEWARPIQMWNETVIVDGKEQPRFLYMNADIEHLDGTAMFSIIEDVADALQTQLDEVTQYFHIPSQEVVLMQDFALRRIEEGKLDDIANLPAWQQEALREAMNYLEHKNEYLRIIQLGNHEEYEMMENFIHDFPLLERQRDRLAYAIGGKGAFRRFKDTLLSMQLADHWYSYRDSEYRRMAREWCDAHEISWGKKLFHLLEE